MEASPYEPVASGGDGLVVLSREEYPFKLCVCDPVTGRRYLLASKEISDDRKFVFPLPVDLLIEVLERCDPRTVVRFGATCKVLWRHVADPAFHCRLRRRLPPADRFLIGLLYHRSRGSFDKQRHRPPPLFRPSSSFDGFPAPRAVASYMSGKLVDSYEPVASGGDGLVVLSREEYPFKLCVCHPVTGRRYLLPSKEISDDRKFVLLPEGEDNGFDLPFRLLVADRRLRTQTFSSAAGAWGPVTHASPTTQLPGNYKQVQPSAVLLGGAVAHWLYREPSTRQYRVLSLDVGTGQPTWTDVPEECHSRRMSSIGVSPTLEHKELLLVPSSPDGTKLGLLVSERLVVSMWVLDPAPPPAPTDSGSATWVRHVVIDRASIIRSVRSVSTNPLVLSCHPIKLESVAGESGTVVMQIIDVGIVLLNLRTLEVHQLDRSFDVKTFETYPFCTYELDLVSLLPST